MVTLAVCWPSRKIACSLCPESHCETMVSGLSSFVILDWNLLRTRLSASH